MTAVSVFDSIDRIVLYREKRLLLLYVAVLDTLGVCSSLAASQRNIIQLKYFCSRIGKN